MKARGISRKTESARNKKIEKQEEGKEKKS